MRSIPAGSQILLGSGCSLARACQGLEASMRCTVEWVGHKALLDVGFRQVREVLENLR